MELNKQQETDVILEKKKYKVNFLPKQVVDRVVNKASKLQVLGAKNRYLEQRSMAKQKWTK